MRKLVTAAIAALTFAGTVVPASFAEARDYRGHRYHNGGYYDGRYYGGRYYRRHRNNDDAAIAAGIAGLAIGAALASGGSRRDRYYDDGYYRRGYYDRGYYGRGYYGRPYRSCRTTSFYDPYYGGYVERTRCR